MISALKKIIREPVNSLTHAFGAVASVVALGFMLYYSITIHSVSAIWASSVFGFGMTLLYLASSIYHWSLGPESRILKLKKFDHISIFILIAGTYTPYCILALTDPLRWIMFGIVWAIAFIGLFIKLFWITAPRFLSTAIYLAMGWMAVIIFPYMKDEFGMEGFFWLAMGGLSYTVGAVIYALKKPNLIPDILGFHEIWHVFVLGGTFCHFWSIYKYVLPLA